MDTPVTMPVAASSYTHSYTYSYPPLSTHVYMYMLYVACISLSLYISLSISLSLSIHIYIYIYMYVCIYIYIYIHTHNVYHAPQGMATFQSPSAAELDEMKSKDPNTDDGCVASLRNLNLGKWASLWSSPTFEGHAEVETIQAVILGLLPHRGLSKF